MRRASSIQSELAQTHTIEDLTEVFESIASMHIARIHSRVVTSKQFFAELWQTYSGLRVDPKERLRRSHAAKNHNVLVAITGEGKLSGSTDEQVVQAMLEIYNPGQPPDILVVGSRGAQLLQNMDIPITLAFPMPASDDDLNVTGLISALNDYDQISVFYETYESLLVQRVTHIELISTVRSLGEDIANTETVSSQDYIFEPGINEIADYMESVMMGVAVIQIVMESKLAHYANRFNNMSRAKKRAGEIGNRLRLDFYRAKRVASDERIKEVLRGVKKLSAGSAL